MEVTKSSEPSMERVVVGRLGERAGRNARERRAGLESYMRRFVLGGKTLGHAQRLKARMVNYADDWAPRRRGREAVM